MNDTPKGKEVTIMAKTQTEVEVEDVELEGLTDETEEADEKSTVMTPGKLAEELDISPKSLRAFLRREFPRKADEKNTSWRLTDAQVEAATAHFTPSDDEEESEEDEA